VPDIAFCWQADSISGWGLYGRALLRHWPGRALPLCPPGPMWVPDEEADRIERLVKEGSAIVDSALPLPVFHALANHGNRRLATGRRNVAFSFVETEKLDEGAAVRLGGYDHVIAGSTWNARVLEAAGVKHVTPHLQGVDRSFFITRARDDRLFRVFSGGKLERRKGQDLVAKAFNAFAERHNDVELVTAWASPWKATMEKPVITGIHAALPITPNDLMPRALSLCDVALFPNRCEGGTNCPAMECLAAGIPTILSANTGHLDLLDRGLGIPLTRQTPLGEGWCESDVEEMVEALERVYRFRPSGAEQQEKMRALTWSRQVSGLERLVCAA